MYKLLEKKSFLAYILCSILLLLFCYRLFYSDTFYFERDELKLLSFIFNLDESKISILKGCSVGLFLITLVNFFNLLHQKDFSVRFELIAVYAVLVHGIIALNYRLSFVDFVSLLYVSILLLQLSQVNKITQTVNSFFTIGLVFGLFAVFSTNVLFYIPVLILSVNIFGKNGFKDLGGLILGLIAPIYILYSIYYLTDSNQLMLDTANSIRQFKYQLAYKWYYIPPVLVLLNVLSAVPLIANFNINSRKLFTIIFSIFLSNAICLISFQFGHSKLVLSLLSIGALYFSIYIGGSRNVRVKNILLILGLIWVIFNTFVIQ